jgi:hypothetical protein
MHYLYFFHVCLTSSFKLLWISDDTALRVTETLYEGNKLGRNMTYVEAGCHYKSIKFINNVSLKYLC